jgi:histidine triad (HIT) family protein
MADCLFCGIAAGAIPSTAVADDGRALAFMDIFPAVEGHVLVIPRDHHDDALAASEDALAACMALAGRVGRAQEAALGATGVTLLSCARPDGWQTVFHLHVHVLPRFPDDGLVIPWPSAPGDPEAIARTAERLRAAL